MSDNTGSGLQKRKALCVLADDDAFELLRLQLRQHYDAEHAATAGEGLAAASTGRYDLYIIDNWWLIDGEGVELCRQIRRMDSTTPILFYSANVAPSEIDSALQAGAQGYIQLPDVSGELLRKVDQLTGTTPYWHNSCAV